MCRLRRDGVRENLRPLVRWIAPLGLAAALAGCAAASAEKTGGFRPLDPAAGVGMSAAQAEAVIAQAITAHEMRRP
jgi:hypothetical protein